MVFLLISYGVVVPSHTGVVPERAARDGLGQPLESARDCGVKKK